MFEVILRHEEMRAIRVLTMDENGAFYTDEKSKAGRQLVFKDLTEAVRLGWYIEKAALILP